jgi:YbbR domain-containing protein
MECLAQYKVAEKLIKLIDLTLITTRARVKINNEYTKQFKIKARVKQGVPLSATSFSLVVDIILKQRDLGRNIYTRLKQCSAYADDILITTRTKQPIIDTFQKLKTNNTFWINCK